MGCKGSEVQILSPRQKPSFITEWRFLCPHEPKERLNGRIHRFYFVTPGDELPAFDTWIEPRGIASPEEETARYVREYVAVLVSTGKKDTTVWYYTRAIKTMFQFWEAEGYLPAAIRFALTKLAKKRLAMLTAEQLQQIARACNVRDKAIVLFMGIVD